MKISTVAIFLAMTLTAMGQHVKMDDYEQKRGYYDAPWYRYEAEPGLCESKATVLEAPASYTQRVLQSEASNCTAMSLVNKGDYVSWISDNEGSGLTVRFSLPDSSDGKGTQGIVGLYVNDKKVAEIELNSYWAWQYTSTSSGERYPDNTPGSNKFVRMRYDEAYVLIDEEIKVGDRFELRKEEDNTSAYTIDFVELEKVAPALTFDDIDASDKVMYEGDGSTLQSFINNNAGKTIFIPAGRYELARRLMINNDNTRLIGAGMWHTIINFTASSDVQGTYSRRGIESNSNGVHVENMTLATVNNKRYYNNNSNYQVGKGFNGSFGSNSVIKNVRVDHFECGAWIADYSGVKTDNLQISYCRFRNNYADGVNLSSGVGNSVVTHCSFRNNGDDDIATWSSSSMAHDNEFSYCTAEHNWRASSLALYGGSNNTAHHILVIDGMESGLHVNGEFAGTGFGNEPSTIKYVTMRNVGCVRGTVGTQGDFWGNAQGALQLTAGTHYDVKNLVVKHIDIFGARGDGVVLQGNGGKSFVDLEMHDITVHSAVGYGFNFRSSARGNGIYSYLVSEDCSRDRNTVPYMFNFVEDESDVESVMEDGPSISVDGDVIRISGEARRCRVWDLAGRKVVDDTVSEMRLGGGVYVVKVEGYRPMKVMVGR